ncbi:MAG: hypothetical protein M1365_08510, partial [Actinobacteria bacterium]|nr:hypothetical protein [Actinomycetota bacterium]
MKKLLIILGIIVAIIVIGIPLFVSFFMLPAIRKDFYGGFPKDPAARKDYVFANSEPWDQNKQKMKYFGYKVPSDFELEQLKNSINLTRQYPTTIKAVFDPGVMANTINLIYYPDELASLGVNTYWVIGEYRLNNNKISQFMAGFNQSGFPTVLSEEDATRMLKWRILLAKKSGFATILIPDYPSANDIGRANFDVAKLKPEFERVALDLAKIGEEYQVEYLQ